MSNTNSLVDLGDGTAVSNNSPQSPTTAVLLDNPITLDFDPMSFQFKEDSPLTSPSDNSRELGDALSPSQNLDVVDFFDPFCPVKEESPTDYYPNVMIDQAPLGEPQTDISPDLPVQEVSFPDYQVFKDPAIPVQSTAVCAESTTVTVIESVEVFQEKMESCGSTDLLTDSPHPADILTPVDAKSEACDDVETITDVKTVTDVDVQHDVETGDLADDNQHAIEQDEVFQHGECHLSDSDLSRRGKISSVSSTISSKSEKKSRKTSSTSSESSLREAESDAKISKLTRKEEKLSQKKELNERKISTEKFTLKSENNHYQAHNGVDKNLKNGIDANHDDSTHQNDTSDSPISVTELKSSFTKSDDESHQSSFQEEVKPSVDRAKVQRTFSQTTVDDSCLCKICSKHVYQMEKMKAEKNVFHKNCFRCKECNKLLNVDTYSSHEGDLYCKPHFKQLFQPKARFDGEDAAPTASLNTDEIDSNEGKQRRNELIIRESVPTELPPDVIRSDSKPDHGLESLPVNLSNLKSKFEQYREEHHLPSTTDVCTLQRSASVMARLAKYQSAVSGENNENGDVSEPESDEGECEDPSIIKPTKHKEKVVFSGMSSLKSQWETGSVTATKEERNEEKKEELNKLRQRMCLGRSESMKAVYEKACQDSTKGTPATRTEPVDLGRDVTATRLKEKFEKGDVTEVDEEKLEKVRKEKEEELSVFTEPVMATDAKKLFMQIDASVKTSTVSPISPSKSPSAEHRDGHHALVSSQSSINEADIVKCSEPTAKEDIPVDTTDLSQRFKFFENYSESPKERKRFQITPPREPAKEDSPELEMLHDPDIVRAVDNNGDIPSTDTARRMLDKFKALEKDTPSVPAGPKPLKRITPPREYSKDENHDSSPEPERDPNIVRASYKADDDIIVEADKAKSLRAKFENWDTELRENRKNEDESDEEFLPQVDTTKTLRAKFEAIKEDTLKPQEKPKAKVNRFV